MVSDSFLGVRKQLVMRRGETLGKLSAAKHDGFNEVATSIALQFTDRVNLLHPLAGYLVKVDGARVAINLGEASGVKPGQEFIVYKESADSRPGDRRGAFDGSALARAARRHVGRAEARVDAGARDLFARSEGARRRGARRPLPAEGVSQARDVDHPDLVARPEIQPELDRARRRRGR